MQAHKRAQFTSATAHDIMPVQSQVGSGDPRSAMMKIRRMMEMMHVLREW